ncbi:MAG: glycosyltransferase family 39 protein [Solirubrobacterales bacterium]|nr:glycosyltransferase family 39 protein [Solirubrobacterales bacterium]
MRPSSTNSVLATAKRWLPRPAAANAVLGVLVVGGLGLRLVAIISWWPVGTTLADSWPYAVYAGTNPLNDPQHPGGYSTLLAIIGFVTRSVAVPVLLQHLLGLLAALLLFWAVRRLIGSPWPALVPAAAVLLNSDEIFLEHTIMAEGPFVVALAGALYASVRAVDQPSPLWKWPAASAILAVAAALLRTAGLFFIPVMALSLWCSAPQPWRARLRVPALVVAVSGVLLLAYAAGSLASNGRFEVSPATGWHLYSRTALIANCHVFTPPKGTAGLCDPRPAPQRPGSDWYLYDPGSPALRLFGPLGNHDSTLEAFALAVILHEPGVYLKSTFHEVEGYFVPSLHPYIYGGGCAIDCQVDWIYAIKHDPAIVAKTERGMEQFYNRFTVHVSRSGIDFLHSYENPFRFGATLLTLTSLLTLLGLFIGPRRARVGVLLFGVGGLAMLVFPTFGVYYLGRYQVPIAGPMAASAAICLWSLWHLERGRRAARVDDPGHP